MKDTDKHIFGVQKILSQGNGWSIKAVLALICILCFSIITWASFSEIDIIAQIQGRIVPTGQVKEVEALKQGGVSQVHVADGEVVKQGQVLVSLDDRENKAQKKALQEELQAIELEIARLNSLSYSDDQAYYLTKHLNSLDIPQNEQNLQQIYLKQAILTESSLIESQENRLQVLKTKLLSEQKRYESYRQIIPLFTKKAEAQRNLYQKKRTTYSKMVEAEEKLAEKKKQQSDVKYKIEELKSEISAYQSDIYQKRSSLKKERLERLLILQADKKIKQQQINQIDVSLENNDILAPIGGVVTELSIYNKGAFMSPGKVIMKIVPQNAEFEVNAIIPDREIGFIALGQEVTLKIDAYDFTKYGTLSGKIIHLSEDILIDEEFGSGYQSRISLSPIDAESLALTSGMKVTADVNTGKRRLIDFILAPLQKMTDESLNQR